jgi:hypothetical protein
MFQTLTNSQTFYMQKSTAVIQRRCGESIFCELDQLVSNNTNTRENVLHDPVASIVKYFSYLLCELNDYVLLPWPKICLHGVCQFFIFFVQCKQLKQTTEFSLKTEKRLKKCEGVRLIQSFLFFSTRVSFIVIDSFLSHLRAIFQSFKMS